MLEETNLSYQRLEKFMPGLITKLQVSITIQIVIVSSERNASLYHNIHMNSGRPWVFGQHRDVVLPAVCHLLDHIAEPFLKPNERGDPVRVARALSAVVS